MFTRLNPERRTPICCYRRSRWLRPTKLRWILREECPFAATSGRDFGASRVSEFIAMWYGMEIDGRGMKNGINYGMSGIPPNRWNATHPIFSNVDHPHPGPSRKPNN